MTRVEHYKGLQTNIGKLYQEIKQELGNEKNLRIVAEMKGDMNGGFLVTHGNVLNVNI